VTELRHQEEAQEASRSLERAKAELMERQAEAERLKREVETAKAKNSASAAPTTQPGVRGAGLSAQPPVTSVQAAPKAKCKCPEGDPMCRVTAAGACVYGL
jgi:sRNA-binding protein